MSGLSFDLNTKYQTDKKLINTVLASVNTMLVGSITDIDQDVCTIQPTNLLTTQDRFGAINSSPYPLITTNFVTPSIYQYVPSIGDKVLLLVSQSNIQDFLNEGASGTLSTFNLLDSVIFPISIGFSDQTKVVAGLSEKDFDINCNNFNVNVQAQVNIQNASANLIPVIIDALTAISNVPINDNIGINTIGDRAPTLATDITKLNTFT